MVEAPNVSAHAFHVGSVLRVIVPDVGHVTMPSCLECAASQANVVLSGSCVLPGDHTGCSDDYKHL